MKCYREINPLSWTMDANKNFNSCCGGWGREEERKHSLFSIAGIPCVWLLLLHATALQRVFSSTHSLKNETRLSLLVFPRTKAAGSFYRKQLGLTSLALRIWNPRGLQFLTCCSHYRYWIGALSSSLRTCQNLAKLSWWWWAPALPNALGKCRVFLLYQSMSFNLKAYILQVHSGP